MKKYPHGLTLRAVCAAIDAFEAQQDDMPESGMIAAFEVLLTASGIGQRAEAAEAEVKHQLNVNLLVCDNHQKNVAERDALRAKLAELEKQEPVAEVSVDGRAADDYTFTINKSLPDGVHELFTRPAPAINRAELVLDENDNPQGFTDWYEHHFATQPYKGASHVTDCENAWRAAILRKIEEAK